MKILYITTDSGWGGSSVALFNNIKILKAKHDICVFLPNKKKKLGKELALIGIKCFSAPFGLKIYPRWQGNVALYIREIYHFIKGLYQYPKAKKLLDDIIISFKPDIIHQNVGPVDIAYDICKKYHIPLVWHMREYQNHMKMHFFPTNKMFNNEIHSIGVYNISITKEMFKHYNLRKGVDEVIYDGVFDVNVKPLKMTKEKYFLFVGRIQPTKGVYEAIEAFNYFNHDIIGYKLLIAGTWETDELYKKKCEEYIFHNNLTGKVIFLGQRNDVYKLMSKAQGLLVLSYFEGFGFITAEAMYNNCVVIGNNTAGTKEQFDNGVFCSGKEIGYRVSNTKEVVDAMKRVVSMDNTEMLKNAFKTVSKMYTAQKCSSSLERFYNKVLSIR